MHVRIRARSAIVAISVFVTVGGSALGVFAATDEPAPPNVTEICEPGGVRVALASADEARQMLVGSWIQCSGPAFWPYRGDDSVGIQFLPDGTFHRLYVASDGHLIAGDGLDERGIYVTGELVDTSEIGRRLALELDFRWAGGDSGGGWVRFYDEPTSFEAPSETRFQRWEGAEPVTGTPPGHDGGACGRPTEMAPVATVEEARTRLVGSWTLCGEQGWGSPPTVGIVFDGDGTWAFLVRSTDGPITREQTHFGGQWNLYQDSVDELDSPFELELVWNGSLETVAPIFVDEPAMVRLWDGPGSTADYLRGEPTLPPTGAARASALLLPAGILLVGGLGMFGIAHRAGHCGEEHR